MSQVFVCQLHSANQDPRCLSCKTAISWTVSRQFCGWRIHQQAVSCGRPAIGYAVKVPGNRVEFYCEDHFDDGSRKEVPPYEI
jgi:hypothetical protein